jgi:tetratricopeptide (TPR) repeat protein
VGTIAERLTTWPGGLILFRDFPWFGAGLGAWPEIFLRYQVPPWTLLFADEAHNDYLQLAVETGVVGLALGVWIALRVLRAVAAGWRSLDAASLPVAAALVAGVAAIGAIEFFDFDLRVPAVALLMAVMAGVALRFVQNASADDWEDDAPSRAGRALAIAGVAAGAVLTLAALGQNSTVYPYNLHVPRTFAEARAGVVAYPASAYLHQSLAELVGDSDPAARDAELARAVWLDPLNPRIRDRYARALVSEGKPAQALEQIRESLLNCPIFRPENHPYLIPRLILWFPPTLQAAVEQGLAEAVDRGYDPAAGSLAEYYAMFGRYDEEARMYQKVADREDDPMRRATDLTLAGEAYVHAGEIEAALPLFRQAADLVPDDARNYVDMAVMIYGPRRDIPAAERVAQQGIENGADPYALSVAVGDAALGAGMRERAEAAYEQALKYRPDAYDLLTHLGSVYAQDGRTERAILTLNRAAEARPDAAGTYFEIGEMEEGRYRYYEAEQAYRKAVKLAPGNPDYRKRLATFEDRLKTESAAEGGGASR